MRYSPGAFKYNDRIALALLPCLVVLGSYAGKVVSGILLVGAMVTYIMDALRWTEAALASVWITLIASNVGFIVSTVFMRDRSLMILFGSLGLNGSTLMLTGLWASLQFRWVLIRHPQVVPPVERLLLATAMPVAMAIQSWGIIGAVGMDVVAFPVMAIGCGLYALCMQPLPSSFQRPGPGIGGAGSSAGQIQGKFEGMACAFSLCMFPTMLYLASHLEVIFEAEHFWSLHLLWSTPAVFICILPRGLWWLSDNDMALQYIRAIVGTAAAIVALFAFEGRVIFHSFSSYIPLHFPLNWIIVSVFLVMHVVLVGAHFAGLLKSQTGFMVGSCLLVFSACAGGVAVGLPLMMMPAPLIGSAGFALFYESRMLRDYFVFVAGTIAAFSWMLWRHFWFLDIAVGSFSLHFVCQLIAVAAVVALVAPGLLITETQDTVIKRGLEAFLLIQATVVTLLEEQLFAGEHDDEVTIYPAYVVLLTSLIGIWFIKRLVANGLIAEIVGWLLQCVYVAKLAMLLLPQAQLVWPSFFMAVTITPPLLLMQSSREQLASWKGSLLAAAIVLSVLFARMAIFDIVQALVSSHPSEGLLLGTLVLVAAAGCAPLYYRFYTHSASARRSMALAVAFGALLCFLRPPLPIRGMAKCPSLPAGLCPRLWDERHVPDHEVDDLEMYGMGWTRREHWPLWLLIGSVMTGLAAVTSPTPVQQSVASRLLWGTLGGLSVGTYLGLEFFPGQDALQVLCVISAVVGCGILVMIQVPSGYGVSGVPFVLVVLWGLLYFAMFVLQAELKLPPVPPGMLRLFPDTPQLLEKERKHTGRAAVEAIFAAQGLLIAFAFKLKVSHALKVGGSHIPGPSGSSWDPRAPGHGGYITSGSASLRAYCGPGGLSAMFSTMVSPRAFDRMAGMMRLTGAGGLMLRRLSAEGLEWIPTTGNVITLFTFLLCLSLNSYFTDGQDIGIFAVTPVLLLLSQDPLMFRDLAEKRRYFPLAVALVVCFWWSSVSEIIGGVAGTYPYLDWNNSVAWFVMRNVGGLLASLPSLLSVLRYLWIHDQLGSAMHTLLFLPLNLIALLFSDIGFVLDLGVMGLIGSLVLAVVYSNLRSMGQRML